jgi:hypothetical protein
MLRIPILHTILEDRKLRHIRPTPLPRRHTNPSPNPLRLDNVMEHFDTSHMDVPAKDDPLLLVGGPGAPLPQFKVFDFGTAVVYPDPYSIKKPRPGGRPAKAAGGRASC